MREKDDWSDTDSESMSPPPPPKGHGGMDDVYKGVAMFTIGEAVQHRKFGFQGVIFDVDPEFANSEEWYNAIPEDVRPRKDQPFYHLFAVNPADHSPYIAYVSQQNLIPLPDGEEVAHPQLEEFFEGQEDGRWLIPTDQLN